MQSPLHSIRLGASTTLFAAPFSYRIINILSKDCVHSSITVRIVLPLTRAAWYQFGGTRRRILQGITHGDTQSVVGLTGLARHVHSHLTRYSQELLAPTTSGYVHCLFLLPSRGIRQVVGTDGHILDSAYRVLACNVHLPAERPDDVDEVVHFWTFGLRDICGGALGFGNPWFGGRAPLCTVAHHWTLSDPEVL